MNEGCCGDYAHFKKYVYISSWCADERENIPMWSLYGRKKDTFDEGVRIKMPTNLFTFDEDECLANNLRLEKILGGWNAVFDVKTKPIELSNFSHRLQEEYGEDAPLFSWKKVVGPIRVRYLNTQEYAKKYTSVLENEDDGKKSTFFVEKIGFEKNDDWLYENEYRFWMSYPYLKEIRGPEDFLKKDIQMTNSNFIDVYFNEKAISEMEIMLAPNFNAGLVEQFQSRLKDLGLTKKLQHSDLDVRI